MSVSRLGARRAVVALIGILGLGSLGLLAYFAVALSTDAVDNRVKRSLQTEAALAARYVRSELTGLGEVVQAFAGRGRLRQTLRSSSPDRALIRRTLVELSRVRGESQPRSSATTAES